MAMQRLDIGMGSLEEGKPVGAEAGGRKLAVVLVSGRVYAINAVCTHKGGPLAMGRVDGTTITCPWHGGKYDLRTGKADKGTPWVRDTEAYEVEVQEDGRLAVDI